MQIFTCQTSANYCKSQLDLEKLSHTHWVQFGQEAFLYADESDWNEIAMSAERRANPLQRNLEASQSENLYLVVQKGRLFQQEHPEVPVLLDKGRFLVVDLEPELAHQCKQREDPCYGLKPLKETQVAFTVRPKLAARRTSVDWIEDLVGQVSRVSLEANLTKLVSWPTRYSTSTSYSEAAAWAQEQLNTMGYQSHLESINVGSSTSYNVIAEKSGHHTGSRDLVLVVAHLDSINIRGGSSATAPGADDNGSGSAGLLEIARVLGNYQSQHDLHFILFGGEEQGLFGSNQYVASLADTERARIKAVLNMDMIGSLNITTPSVLIEGASLSESAIDGLAEAAETYTELAVEISLNPFASDHVPFLNAGIPAVLTIEGSDSANSNVHTANDILANINYELIEEILRMNVAFIATVIG